MLTKGRRQKSLVDSKMARPGWRADGFAPLPIGDRDSLDSKESGMTKNSVGGEAVLDFMFWPGRQHKLGWYLEPDMTTTLSEGMSDQSA
jgi:hypothetical protein